MLWEQILGMAASPPAQNPVAHLWRTCITRVFGSLILLIVSFSSPAAGYTLAVVPQATPAEAHRHWAPFAEQVQRATGQHLTVRVYRTFDEFETDLVNGFADFAYMNPYHFLMARKAQGYLPLVRDGSRSLSGLLLVRRDSPLKSIKDLNGKDIAFPDPNAFAASIYMRAQLQERGNIRFTPRYLTTHANVYRHVILGSVAAGAGVNVTFARELPETRAELRVLYETPGTAPHPLCAHPRVPASVRESVSRAVLEMGKNDNGRGLLKRVDLIQPVRASYERDYQPLEKLGLEKYVVQTQLRTR
jgi:phosphonate transport system substrate-binding protein